MKPGRFEILGVPVDAVDLEGAAAAVVGFVAQGGAHLVVTPNPEMAVEARHHGALRRALDRADLALPDGVGMVWAARLLGVPLRGRVTGVDLVERLLAMGVCGRAGGGGAGGEGGREPGAVGGEAQDRPAANGGAPWRFYFLGARPGVAAEAARRARARYPGVEVRGTHHGYFSAREEPAVVEGIRRAAPHILVVGMGSPRQEDFLLRHLEKLGVPVALAVGGTLDVLAGRARRAPAALQRLGLEWLWRLVKEPSRWRRALALPRFAWAVMRAAVRRRAGR